MVEQNGFDNAFTTDEYWRLRQLLDEDAIRNLTCAISTTQTIGIASV